MSAGQRAIEKPLSPVGSSTPVPTVEGAMTELEKARDERVKLETAGKTATDVSSQVPEISAAAATFATRVAESILNDPTALDAYLCRGQYSRETKTQAFEAMMTDDIQRAESDKKKHKEQAERDLKEVRKDGGKADSVLAEFLAARALPPGDPDLYLRTVIEESKALAVVESRRKSEFEKLIGTSMFVSGTRVSSILGCGPILVFRGNSNLSKSRDMQKRVHAAAEALRKSSKRFEAV